MSRKVLKTYDRKNNGKLDLSSIQTQSILKPVEIKKTTEKECLNDSLEDPFDTTFDRLLRDYKNQPVPPPNPGLSYTLYNDSSLKQISASDSDDDFVFESKMLKKKPRLEKQSSSSEKYETKSAKSSKLVNEKEAMKNVKRPLIQSTIKVSKRKLQQERKLPAEKSKRIRNNSFNELANSVPVEEQKCLEDNFKNDSCVHNHNTSDTFSTHQVSHIISPRETSKSDSGTSSKISHSSLRRCSIPLEPCDWMLKKKEPFFKLKSCSIKISRLKVNSKPESIEVSMAHETENVEKKVENKPRKKSDEKLDKSSERTTEEEHVYKFRKSNNTVEKSNLNKIKSPMVLKNCSVSLTRLNSPKPSFIKRLVSSTPVVKKKVNLLLGEFLPVNMEISNIASLADDSRIPPTPAEFRNASKECVTETWNNSSDYSEIDWVTVSYSQSQLGKEPSLQRKYRSFSAGDEIKSNSTKNNISKNNSFVAPDLSNTKEISLSKNLEVSLSRCDVVAKRILNDSPEYEKSTSLFDDTKFIEDEFIPSLKIPILPEDNQVLIKSTPLPVKKLSILEKSKSFTSSSILNQSDFMGFEDHTKHMLYSKKLSPMTSIPTSIVHSITLDDSIKDSLFIEEENEKIKLLRSLAFEKSNNISGLKSPKKCLNFDTEPKIFSDNESSDLISSNEKYDKESQIQEDKIVEVLKNDSLKIEKSQSLERRTTSSNGNKVDDADLKMKDKKSLENNSQNSFIDDSPNCAIKNSQHSLQDSSVHDSQETIKYENYIKPEVKTQKRLQGRIENELLITKAVNNSEINRRESLNRLKDPVRITYRRKNYLNWGLQLSAISENENKRLNETSPVISDDKFNSTQEDGPSICDTVSLTSSSSLTEEAPEQHLFLKPGKSWARSLSILNNIHCQNDMDRFSVGKGKKWRNSVISILDMQNKGILQSCTKQQEVPNSTSPCKILNGNVDQSKIERFSTFGSVSPNRFVKRISIRVVPDAKKLDSVEDTQFLEAYGIPSSQSNKSFSQRFSSTQENRNFVASPQKNVIGDVLLEESVIKTVDSHPLVTAKDVVLEKCRQEDYLPFNQCYPNKFLKYCRKIGEGVYGEVFLHDNESESSVIKIIPIEGNALVNGEPQKKFHEILSEIVIAKELHDLRFNEKYNTSSFVEVKNIKCIMGKYPQKLIELWQTFDDEKKSENDCPSMFGNDQLYISLELGNGGQDLEAFVFQNANESYSIFIQTAIALAVAEQSLEFEHRDLHWGNILISRTKKSQVSYKLGNLEINLPSNGLKVVIIDFTLSRMSYKGCCIFNDLALDPALFTAEGEYQFEIYRLMRDKLGNNWQTFEPYTNILWLHYTLDKMITSVRYNKKKKVTKIHKNAIERLRELKEEILSYDSAYDLVTKCDKFTALYDDLNYSIADGTKKSL